MKSLWSILVNLGRNVRKGHFSPEKGVLAPIKMWKKCILLGSKKKVIVVLAPIKTTPAKTVLRSVEKC